MDNSIFDRKRKGGVASATPPSQPVTPRWIGIAAVAILAILALIVMRSLLVPQTTTHITPTVQPTSIQQSTATSVPIAVIATAIPPTPAPECTSAASSLKIITMQEEQTNWPVATQNILALLNDPLLCVSDRTILSAKYATDALEGLYEEKFSPDRASQQAMVEEYESIKVNSERYGARLPSSLSIASRAAQTGKYLLAKKAYDDAWVAGSFTAADRTLIHDYISNLYNIGKWWSEDGNKDGYAYLVTSYHLSTKYNTGQAEAWGLLRQHVGADERFWPEGVASPL